METIYILFFAIIGIIIAIGLGLQLSHDIEDFIIYVLFWMLYIVTIITFVNIILVINYYLNMKNKSGPPGKDGIGGKRGDKGATGLCDPKCRDSICENQINELIISELTNKNNGKVVKLNNTYIKSKVRQMCASDEFKQLAPYNGPQNLINYLKDIWKIWLNKMYESGGMAYFNNVAAEDEFDWLTDNPFNDIKKYDVFYWGMGKQYRPQVINKCYPSTDGNNPDPNATGLKFRASNTTLYDKLGDDNNSGSYNNVSFWRPRQFTYKGAVYYPVGDVALGPTTANDNTLRTCSVGIINFPQQLIGPNRETIIVSGDGLVGPIYYELKWTNYGYTDNPFWLWCPIAPAGYISLGDVVTFYGYQPPAGDSAPIRCVPKNITLQIPPNGNRLWSSVGSDSPTNVSLLGYVPNDENGYFVSANASNVYNLFRAVPGVGTYIPPSDINGSFYYLDPNKYNIDLIIGVDKDSPSSKVEDIQVGKGYVYNASKDAKYSVLAYLNLKNNAILTHSVTKIQVSAQLIPDAISNAYLIQVISGNIIKCLNYDEKSVTLAECNELNDDQTINDKQIFSIVFTGNKTNECKLQHYSSKNMIMFKNGLFTLVSPTELSNIENQLFMMSS
jgi:hypothetical protein